MPSRSEYEEWRLAFEVPEGGPDPATLVDSLDRQLPPHVHVHRKGKRGVRVYAPTRAEIDVAFESIGEKLAARRVQADILLSRWNPGAARWQAPSLPLDPVPESLPDAWSELDEFAWEVRLRFETDWEVLRLVDELRSEGLAVLEGWRRCLVALPDQTAARELAERLQQAAPRAEREVRPLSRFRKWQIRQRVYGNYAQGADIGGPQSP